MHGYDSSIWDRDFEKVFDIQIKWLYYKYGKKEGKEKNEGVPNKYDKMTPAQKDHWNKYNKEYAKKNYKNYTLTLNIRNDADVIAYIESQGESMSQIVRKLVRGINK